MNGQPVERLALTAENNDLFHQIALKNVDSSGANAVEVRFTGTGSLAYQIAGRYFVPWSEKPANEPLSITVDYDRTRLAQDDIATATAIIRHQLGKTANMVMVDLGIPPASTCWRRTCRLCRRRPRTAREGAWRSSASRGRRRSCISIRCRRAQVEVKFRLRPKYPIRARTFRSRVYEYYDPEVGSVARPVQLEVRAK